MDCSVYKKQTYQCVWDKVLRMGHYLMVAHPTHLPWAKFFYLIHQLGGTYPIMGRESHDSTLLHKLTGSHVAYGTYTSLNYFELNKVL